MVAESILLISTFSLAVELVVLGLLIFGYRLKRIRKYRNHGTIMTAAVPLHLATISWMIFSFVGYLTSAPLDFGNPLILLAITHVIIGTVAVSLGAWLVISWHLQSDLQKCFTRKRQMRTAIVLWSTAIFLGIVLYVTVILG